jgi:hypothetical protein
MRRRSSASIGVGPIPSAPAPGRPGSATDRGKRIPKREWNLQQHAATTEMTHYKLEQPAVAEVLGPPNS